MEFDGVIEIPEGQRNKYEMDHDTGRIRLNRMLFTSTRYPAGYGFVEHTLADDGDALDALVILDEPAFAACPISCRAIGRRPPLNWPVGALVGDIRVWSGDVWVVDSTQVECVHSRDTVRRSDLADWAAYGYCASHSRYFWGLRLQMVATMHGLPVGRAGLTHIADKTATAVTSRRPWYPAGLRVGSWHGFRSDENYATHRLALQR